MKSAINHQDRGCMYSWNSTTKKVCFERWVVRGGMVGLTPDETPFSLRLLHYHSLP